MNDEMLALDVSEELLWDPKIDATGITVTADSGVVTLRGTVLSLREKREATKAAESVLGVQSVDNEIDVELVNDHRRDDADLRGDVLQALMLDLLVPTTVDVTVKDGQVTLFGPVDWKFQRDEAEFIASNVMGVTGVVNDIVLDPIDPAAVGVEHKIKKALSRNAKLEAEGLQISTSDGTVSLKGQVRTLQEHDAAVAAAWSAPGVKAVDDQLTVTH